jgi:hypothetical protein
MRRRVPVKNEDVIRPLFGIADADFYLLELVLRQLPMLVESDTDLAWMAFPFLHNRDDAGRLLAAYRSGSITVNRGENFQPHPASIVHALEFSLISETQAIIELFNSGTLDVNNISAVSKLIGNEADQNFFLKKLLAFTGTVFSDEDGDGIPESRAYYNNGALQEFFFDEDQDGIDDLYISFNNGLPQWAKLKFNSNAGAPEIKQALIHWENYPAVLRSEADGVIYIARPREFHFSPVNFIILSGNDNISGLLLPSADKQGMKLSRRLLAYHAFQIHRPSIEFKGAIEQIDLELGIPWRSSEFLNGHLVSITVYKDGRPIHQQVDLDGDSRMETRRRFRIVDYSDDDPLAYSKIIEFSQSDWDGDGIYEYYEEHHPDGSIRRNFSEIRTGSGNE